MLTVNIETMKAEVSAHIAADAVVQGTYWNEGRGCFIGCLTHSDRAETVTKRFGMPLPLVKICEHIFEGLDATEAVAFFAAIPESIGNDGKDLSRLHWLFLIDTLKRLPIISPETQTVIDGLQLLADGKEWPQADTAADAAAAAARAAAAAARAAYYTAYYAAHAAADAAADAARAARAAAATASAEIKLQRDCLLRLMCDAK